MTIIAVVTSIAYTVARTVEEDAGFDPDAVTPGVIGFLVTAVFALAVILLGWDLGRRLRRNRYREEIRQSLEAELAERDAAAGENGAAGASEADGGSGEPRG